MNIKRLIDDIQNGEQSTPPLPRFVRRRSLAGPVSDEAAPHLNLTFDHLKQSVDFLKKKFQLPHKTEFNILAPSNLNQSLTSITESYDQTALLERREFGPNSGLIKSIFSCVMTWGIDSIMDDMLKGLGMIPHSPSICVGFRGY